MNARSTIRGVRSHHSRYRHENVTPLNKVEHARAISHHGVSAREPQDISGAFAPQQRAARRIDQKLQLDESMILSDIGARPIGAVVLPVRPYLRQGLIDQRNLAAQRQPVPQIIVLRGADRFIECAGIHEQAAGGQHAGRPEGHFAAQHRLENLAFAGYPWPARFGGQHIAAFIHVGECGVAPQAELAAAQGFELRLELARLPKVVRIEEGNVLTGGLAQRGIADGGRNAGVRQPDDFHLGSVAE